MQRIVVESRGRCIGIAMTMQRPSSAPKCFLRNPSSLCEGASYATEVAVSAWAAMNACSRRGRGESSLETFEKIRTTHTQRIHSIKCWSRLRHACMCYNKRTRTLLMDCKQACTPGTGPGRCLCAGAAPAHKSPGHTQARTGGTSGPHSAGTASSGLSSAAPGPRPCVSAHQASAAAGVQQCMMCVAPGDGRKRPHRSPVSLCTQRCSVWLCTCSFAMVVMGARRPCRMHFPLSCTAPAAGNAIHQATAGEHLCSG